MLDPVVERISEDVVYDRDAHKMFFRGVELEGETFPAWRAALTPRLYLACHVGQEFEDPDDVESFLPDIVLEESIIRATPIPFRESEGVFVGCATAKDGSELGLYTYLSGMKVLVPSDRVISCDHNVVRYKTRTLRPRLSAGFMFFIGQAYNVRAQHLLRLYRKAEDPSDILDVWSELVDVISAKRLPITMKMLSRMYEYPRRDALVLYLNEGAWSSIDYIVRILSDGQGITTEDTTDRFAHRLTDNVMCGWEPADPMAPTGKESFGQQRARRLAEGLILDREQGSEDCDNLIAKLVEGNIDPTAIYRNLDSPQGIFYGQDRW